MINVHDLMNVGVINTLCSLPGGNKSCAEPKLLGTSLGLPTNILNDLMNKLFLKKFYLEFCLL